MAFKVTVGNNDRLIDRSEIDENGFITVKISFEKSDLGGNRELYIRSGKSDRELEVALTDQDVANGYISQKVYVGDYIDESNFRLMVITDGPVLYDQNFCVKNSLETLEDQSHTLKAVDFGIYDQNTQVTEVQIKTLPTNGTLVLNGVNVSVDDKITLDDIRNGNLKFEPNANTDEDKSFDFVNIKGSDVSNIIQHVSTDIKAVADAPTLEISKGINSSDPINPGDATPVHQGEGLEYSVYNKVFCGTDWNCDDFVANSNILQSVASHYQEKGFGETKTVSELSASNIPCENLIAAKGYIYLEAGQKVSFSGYVDDNALIKLGGQNILYTLGDAYGEFNTAQNGVEQNANKTGTFHSTGTFVAPESGYFAIETYMFNRKGAGKYDIKMSVDGGEAKEINSQNFEIFPSQKAVMEYTKNVGFIGQEIELSEIKSELVDKDGSEVLSLKVSGVPVGVTLSDGNGHSVVSDGKTAIDVTNWSTNSLKVTNADKSFTLNIEATSTEKHAHGEVAQETATTTGTLNVSVVDSANGKATFIPQRCGCERDLQYDIGVNEVGQGKVSNDNDFIVIGDDIGSSHTTTSRTVNVDTGAGNDVIELDGAIDWHSTINMGTGDDYIDSGAGSIKGESVVKMGEGNDIISTRGGIYGAAQVLMEEGDDTLNVRANIDYAANVNMGAGNDTVNVKGGMYAKANLATEDGNDTVNIGGSLHHKSSIDTGADKDIVNIGGSLNQEAKIDTGADNDIVNIGYNVRHNSSINTGDGNDIVNVGAHVGNKAVIDTGNGDDVVTVKGSMWDKAQINMGDGNDLILLRDDCSIKQDAHVDAGDGYDKLVLTNPGGSIDLTKLATHVDNVEELDISSKACTNVTLSVSDIIDMTDSNNVLKISSDGNGHDKVSNEKVWSWDDWKMGNKDHWEYQGTKDGYKEYIGTDIHSGAKATLLVEDVIHTDF